MTEKDSVRLAPVQVPTLSFHPFQKVAVDLVGEIHQQTR